ncbi:aminodeoxychorismate/anthranilate synthase component II [Sulfolobales archaeon HS-7]|nr:aminodeoxychorismate/anthranilate synthase component II [Sulfolobales archaeon HS-7]
MDITLIIDNYDSFVFNIYQLVAQLGTVPIVIRNDEISLSGVMRINPDRVIISPGPGTPLKKEDVGISLDIVKNLGVKIPILGVCLGHQIIGYAYGANIEKANTIFHGKISEIFHYNSRLYYGIPNTFHATRYHSLVVRNVKTPLRVTAVSKEDQEVMGIEHEEYRVYGVQFHPESVGTREGYKILYNFINKV